MADLPRLAIVGASVRAAAQSAVRAGFEVVAADLFADQDLRRLCDATRITDYPAGLPDWLAAARADAWMYTGALENHTELVDRMATIKPLWGNAGEPLRLARSPALLRRALAESGLHFPETRCSAAGLPRDGSWLCKTGRGSSGSGVWTLTGPEALARANQAGAEFQQRLTPAQGVPASVVFVLDGGRSQTLGVARQVLGDGATSAGAFQHTGSTAPLYCSEDVEEQFIVLRSMLSGRFGLRGIVGVDLWLGAERAWVLEVNPRYSASVQVHELRHGASMIAAHAAAFGCACCACSEFEHSEPLSQAASQIVFARQDLRVPGDFPKWALERAAGGDRCLIADIPAAGEQIARGSPVVTVLAAGQQEIQTMISTLVAEVEIHLYAGD